MKRFIGIDVGGTSAKFGIFNEKGELLARSSVRTGKVKSPEQTMAEFIPVIQQLVEESDAKKEDLCGVGIGMPGPVLNHREVNGVVNMGWGYVKIADFFEERLSCPIAVENDANVAALGEQWQGAGKGRNSVLLVTLGTGVGGGIVVDEHIISGLHGAAGEIGHMSILTEPEERTCGCGKHDCLELIASATGIAAQARRLLETSDTPSLLRNYPSVDAKKVFDCAEQGDVIAQAVVDRTTDVLGRALAIVGAALDPELFIIGGGVSNAREKLLMPTKKAYQKYALYTGKDTPIIRATLGNDAGIYGAVRLILQITGYRGDASC